MAHMSQFAPIGSQEVARILNKSRATVNRQALAGSLPYVSKLGGATGAYLFDRAEIERIAQEKAPTCKEVRA